MPISKRDPIDPHKIIDFLTEIIQVCMRHGLSISHEDIHGGFLIEPFNEELAQWLMEAEDGEVR